MKKDYKELLQFGGKLSNKTNNILVILGAIVILLIWHLLTLSGNIIPDKILPSPSSVFKQFSSLVSDYNLIPEAWYSIKLNIYGYFFGIIFALPLGFILGIYALPKGMFAKYTDGLRYLPPPAITGIFTAILGYGFGMKATFLAFAIFISLLPCIIQKISDLQNPKNNKDFVYLQTIKTLGASNFQKLTKVYIPYVMGRLWDDIVNLTAITWTYIIIVELLNREGGLGGLIHVLKRQGLVPEMYGVLFCIISIGIMQDFILKNVGNLIFPYKSNSKSIFQKTSKNE